MFYVEHHEVSDIEDARVFMRQICDCLCVTGYINLNNLFITDRFLELIKNDLEYLAQSLSKIPH